MVASMLRAQRRDPAKAQAKCAFATNYPLANRQLRSPLILRYRMQRDKPYRTNPQVHAPKPFRSGHDLKIKALIVCRNQLSKAA